MPPNVSDGYIMLKPIEQWPQPHKTREELPEGIRAEAAKVPGNAYEFSQPIQLRFNELISGVRSDVAVKLFGDDNEVLNETATRISAALEKVAGATEVKVEQTTGLPMLSVNIDRAKAARYGLNIADIQQTVSAVVGGREAGTFFQGDRRFDILVRLPDTVREDLEALRWLPVPLPQGAEGGRATYIPLGEVAALELAPGPNQVSRENGKRRVCTWWSKPRQTPSRRSCPWSVSVWRTHLGFITSPFSANSRRAGKRKTRPITSWQPSALPGRMMGTRFRKAARSEPRP